MINTSNFSKAKDLLRKEEKPKIVLAQDKEFNRKMLEKAEFDILLSPESNTSPTTIRSIDSGLNHVLCRIAEKKGIKIGIDLENIRNLEKKRKAINLEKIIQNIKLCRKYHVQLAIKGAKDKADSLAFLLSLGASTEQASKALTF
ncbi:MAG: hypothetical protein AABX35_01155 [Nanoarchaeota archaeon]